MVDILGNDDFLPNSDDSRLGNTFLYEVSTTGVNGQPIFTDDGFMLLQPLGQISIGDIIMVEYRVCSTSKSPKLCEVAKVTITITE